MRQVLALGLLSVCCSGPDPDPTLCSVVEASAWDVPEPLRPLLEVEEGCMFLKGEDLYAIAPSGYLYDAVPAVCEGGIVKVEGHGDFILEETPEGLEVYSAKYRVSLELEPCSH